MGRGSDDAVEKVNPRHPFLRKIKPEEEAEREERERNLLATEKNNRADLEAKEEEERILREREEYEEERRRQYEKERREAEARAEARRQEIKKFLQSKGVVDFSQYSAAYKALSKSGFLPDDYETDVLQTRDEFLLSEGSTHTWRVRHRNGREDFNGTAPSEDEAKQAADRVVARSIEKHWQDLSALLEKEKRRKGKLGDLPVRAGGYDLSKDVDHLERTTLPGGYDVVSGKAKKIIVDSDGDTRRSDNPFSDTYEKIGKRRLLLVFKNGELLPIADGGSFYGGRSRSDGSDKLGITRFMPGLIHKHAVAEAKELLKDYLSR